MLSVSDAPVSVLDTFAGRHLIVTGFTGFLGKVWVGMLLDRMPEVDLRLTLLIRSQPGKGAASGRSALDRFIEIVETSPAFRPIRERHGDDLARFLDARIDVLDGDVGKPMCGLAEATVKRLAETADAVINVAGLTDFDPDPIASLQSNVFGADNAADLAAQLEQPRLVHVSTCFVAGAKGGRVPERFEPGKTPKGVPYDLDGEIAAIRSLPTGHRKKLQKIRVEAVRGRATALGWPNIYTYSKALAEALVARRDDIQLSISRPAIIECALHYPFPGWTEGMNTAAPLAWLNGHWWREMPAVAANHFDIIPVDLVASGMVHVVAAALRNQHVEVTQQGCSDINPFFIENAIELTGLWSRKRFRNSKRISRRVMRLMDPVAVSPSNPGLFRVKNLRKVIGGAKSLVDRVKADALLPPSLASKVGAGLDAYAYVASNMLGDTDRQLSLVEKLFDVFKPFVGDTDWIFQTSNMRTLVNQASAEDRALFPYEPESIDWMDYWVNVEVPGLERWSWPILRGDRPALDPKFDVPLKFTNRLAADGGDGPTPKKTEAPERRADGTTGGN